MIFTLIVSLLLIAHPIHVSVTEITADEKEKELEIISRIFIDDLENSIRQARNQPELDLMEPTAPLTTDQLLREYLQPRFKISLDSKPVAAVYLGHEVENEALLCYIQVKNVKKWNTIEVFNNIITELYDDQSNLVHVTVKGEVKSLRLMKDTPAGKITFNTKLK